MSNLVTGLLSKEAELRCSDQLLRGQVSEVGKWAENPFDKLYSSLVH